MPVTGTSFGSISLGHLWECGRGLRSSFWPVNAKGRIARSCITATTSAASSATWDQPPQRVVSTPSSAMREETITADRLIAFSDAVFAVIVTVMVLELKAPDELAFSALWPTAVSYAVSYLFIAIIWINHHHLMRYVGPPTPGLIWINFVHLFMVSLLPCETEWVAHTRRASAPVVPYAGLFVCVDVASNAFEHHVCPRPETT